MRELLEQALYALEYAADMTKPDGMSGCTCPICATIPLIKAALAKPEQQPVSYRYLFNTLLGGQVWRDSPAVRSGMTPIKAEPLYAAPVTCQWPTCKSEEYQQALEREIVDQIIGKDGRDAS